MLAASSGKHKSQNGGIAAFGHRFVASGRGRLSRLDAVRMTPGMGCGGPPTYSGWYLRLLFGGARGDMEPTIADVHTDVRLGDPVVLHVATGLPRLMVVTRETCSGPRAYAGLAFAYHELIKPLPRLSDEDWLPLAPTAEDAAFVKPILP